MFVENPGIVSFVVSSQQNTKTNERTPGFSTNIYHLNEIQNTTTNETIPGFPTKIYHLNKIQKQMKESLGFPQTYIISTKY
jgi:hypothetical protein